MPVITEFPQGWPGPGAAAASGAKRRLAGQRAGEYRVGHPAEGLPGVNGDGAGCAQAVLVSRQEAAQVLASVPDMAPVVVVPALVQPCQEHLSEATGQL